jgi:hypothetical protein
VAQDLTRPRMTKRRELCPESRFAPSKRTPSLITSENLKPQPFLAQAPNAPELPDSHRFVIPPRARLAVNAANPRDCGLQGQLHQPGMKSRDTGPIVPFGLSGQLLASPRQRAPRHTHKSAIAPPRSSPRIPPIARRGPAKSRPCSGTPQSSMHPDHFHAPGFAQERRAVDVNRPVTSLVRSCCDAGRAEHKP